ncbi:50S ribosomal protein L17 [Candidatus Giovannonibacteria bacterium RIFCSPHIGHO2_01_FULL_45_33]|uniref:50S ribosomal protein L17 n=1 Tax=Candidatus Giovannonibacteria bacterium RIFCSPLOWO2_01_FULL_45_34 TaxID=1798351 RepID=A0A1F5WYM0_9BACT|nr:MAG: 50S ribosomal protein L17 [Candidatus Giovannonibacteria bacterium RIFCSPHIGHO2_01_FULL_45_33]OGF70893.1 MAG: 50S ribosomal protein L17 [Candidatus Giovannonibacteria bacterium RIFCSPHIGHO2_02_FULL_44_11]OGF80730.1 MAG: 50S ribosomal protein L17 [Candidatus Giovannonibacteria bacterium RIFCSPLOWO2_01_FULL_45_34]
MKHQKKGRKFGRERNQRRAFMKGLAVALVMKGKIKTTLARAKSLGPYAERLITYGKSANKTTGSRRISAVLPKVAAKKLMMEIAPKYADRNGGYTRIIKIGRRAHDAASMAFIEFV